MLSSTWRLGKENREDVKKYAIDFIDTTGESECRIRGCEILQWLKENVGGYYKPYKCKYAIIDDDSDMLLWQKDSFFQTDFEIGLTQDICDKIRKHFNET